MEKSFGNVTSAMENRYYIMENVEIFVQYIIINLVTIALNVMKNVNIVMELPIKNALHVIIIIII
jgi:hypothetical protein